MLGRDPQGGGVITHEVAQDFAQKCCLSWGVPFEQLRAHRRDDQGIIRARKALAWMIRKQFGSSVSYPQIGRILDRDHQTIMYGAKGFQRALDSGEPWAMQALREASQQVRQVIPTAHQAFLLGRFERCA